jgi:hypothetical protein
LKKVAVILVLLLAPTPAIAGHEKAPARLGIPVVVGEYLHQFAGMHATLIRNCREMPCTALVAFFDTEDESSWVGTATFEVNGDGSLGRLLIFRFPDGHRWVYEGDDLTPGPHKYHSEMH